MKLEPLQGVKVKISIIAAVALNGVIGRNGNLPWYLPTDLKHFANTTRRHTIIVGRKTHESILKRRNGKPLKDRVTIVLSRNPDYRTDPCLTARSLQEAFALAEAHGEEEVFVIGGSEVYQEALPLADRLYLTLIHVFAQGDSHFPTFNPNNWKMAKEESMPQSDTDEHPFTFRTYDRISNPTPVSK